jgi:hypothetical protein
MPADAMSQSRKMLQDKNLIKEMIGWGAGGGGMKMVGAHAGPGEFEALAANAGRGAYEKIAKGLGNIAMSPLRLIGGALKRSEPFESSVAQSAAEHAGAAKEYEQAVEAAQRENRKKWHWCFRVWKNQSCK